MEPGEALAEPGQVSYQRSEQSAEGQGATAVCPATTAPMPPGSSPTTLQAPDAPSGILPKLCVCFFTPPAWR